MEAYTYGSRPAIKALKKAIKREGSYSFTNSESRAEVMVNALETAAYSGNIWAEMYTGLRVEKAAQWAPYFASCTLNAEQMTGLVDALTLAWELGDENAGDWLSSCAHTLDMEWI